MWKTALTVALLGLMPGAAAGASDDLNEKLRSFSDELRHRLASGSEHFPRLYGVGSRSSGAIANFGGSGRQLATTGPRKICAWANGACDVDVGFRHDVISSLPGNSPLRLFWKKYRRCERSKTMADCTELEEECQWSSARNMCEAHVDHAMGFVFVSHYTDFNNCGWVTHWGRALRCRMHNPRLNECTGTCQISQGFEPVDSRCVMQEFCGTNMTAVVKNMCGQQFDYQQETARCNAQSMSAGARVECLSQSCPDFGSMSRVLISEEDACTDLKTESACDTNEKCDWNHHGGCRNNQLKIIGESLPDTCKLKHIFSVVGGCRSTNEMNCKGNCSWQMSKVCNEMNMTEEDSCEISNLHVLRLAAENGSGEAARVAELYEAEMRCPKYTDEATCQVAQEVMYAANR
mmetsp:Transcript_94822/g.306622  ORF Transcript_94822/g.306622 Transcript_94822/m.306622 type:complete len:405 (-) Transcript_94822:199-1413(-)